MEYKGEYLGEGLVGPVKLQWEGTEKFEGGQDVIRFVPGKEHSLLGAAWLEEGLRGGQAALFLL